MKAVVQSADYLIKNKDKAGSQGALNMEMLELCGQEVTIKELNYGAGGSGPSFEIEEDDDGYTWYPWMFSKLPKLANRPITISFLSDIDDNGSGKIHADGSVTVGCALVGFETLEDIYQKALAVRSKNSNTQQKAKPARRKK